MEKEKYITTSEFAKLDKQMVGAVDNFFTFTKKGENTAVDIRLAIGFWVLWNIMGSPPTEEESAELAPAIGTYLQNLISNFN